MNVGGHSHDDLSLFLSRPRCFWSLLVSMCALVSRTLCSALHLYRSRSIVIKFVIFNAKIFEITRANNLVGLTFRLQGDVKEQNRVKSNRRATETERVPIGSCGDL